jgi:hypothetical protein
MTTADLDLPEHARVWRTPDTRARDQSGTAWPAGPWDDEPDKVSWTDQATGRPCLIVRNRLGALCGYVAVDPGHPLYGIGYSDVPDAVHEAAHGGLTYASPCQEVEDEAHGICHVPEPGAPDDVWWLGFDCAHAGDLAPAMEATRRELDMPSFPGLPRDKYRTVGYVRRRCEDLAAALASAGDPEARP